MNAAQLELTSAPTADRAERVAASGLSAENRRESRDSAVTTCKRRERVDDGNRPRSDESHRTPASMRLTAGARVIYDHTGHDSASVGEIARRAGFISAAVRRHLAALAELGLVAEAGGRWRRA